jgi:hypothetical protein
VSYGRSFSGTMTEPGPRLTENTYMDERLLPIAEELAAVPAIPCLGSHSKAAPRATPGATHATQEQQKTVVWRLELTPPDNTGQEQIVEMVVRGTRSQVEQLQRLGQALAPNAVRAFQAAMASSA